MAKPNKNAPRTIKMTEDDAIIQSVSYPTQVYDQHKHQMVKGSHKVETMKRYNKNVKYTVPPAVADELVGRKTAVLVS